MSSDTLPVRSSRIVSTSSPVAGSGDPVARARNSMPARSHRAGGRRRPAGSARRVDPSQPDHRRSRRKDRVCDRSGDVLRQPHIRNERLGPRRRGEAVPDGSAGREVHVKPPRLAPRVRPWHPASPHLYSGGEVRDPGPFTHLCITVMSKLTHPDLARSGSPPHPTPGQGPALLTKPHANALMPFPCDELPDHQVEDGFLKSPNLLEEVTYLHRPHIDRRASLLRHKFTILDP